jgi:hypothetical protein
LWRTAAQAQFFEEARTSNSLVVASTLSPWLIQTCVSLGTPRKSLSAVLDREVGAAVLAVGRGGHLGAEELGAELEAVADAQDRDAEFEDLGIAGWARGAGRRSPGRPRG